MASSNYHKMRPCRQCRAPFLSYRGAGFCSHSCMLQWTHKKRCQNRDDSLPAAVVDSMLEEAVRLETAPPWERHPVPQTGVVYRRAGT